MAAPTASEEELVLLREQIVACEEVIDSAEHAIEKQAGLIEDLSLQNNQLDKALNYEIMQNAKESAWYRDTSITAPIAAVLGIVLGAYITKR